MTTTKPFILTPRMVDILKAVHYYRYMTALDVTYLLSTPGVLAHVRKILRLLCGGTDYVDNQYLFRFPLPQLTSGKTEKVFTLGQKGRDFLTREVGLPVEWYFRPQHIKHLSHGLLIHHLTLTRFLVAAHVWAKSQPETNIESLRIAYELEKDPAKIHLSEHTGEVKVIPDAWLLFSIRAVDNPVLVEIDRGTEFKQRFKQHIKTRIELIRSGEHERIFGKKASLIAYATTGELPEYRETRLASMRKWTQETLTEMRLPKWASIMRFTSIERTRLYELPLFTDKLWYRPDNKTPLPLFAD